MTMKDLSKQDEALAMQTLEKAVKLANSGMDPSEALAKVAEDAQLPPQMVQRLVEAFNISKTLNYFHKTAGEDRAKSFAIADPQAILRKIYPDAPETPATKAAGALHPDYWIGGVSADLMKAAASEKIALPPLVETPPQPYERDPAAFAKSAIDFHNKIAVDLSNVEGRYREFFYRMLGEMDKLASYWRQLSPTEPFDLVEKRAYARYGKPSVPFMGMVYEYGKLDDSRVHVKRAAAEELGQQKQMAFDSGVEPYRFVADAMLFAKAADDFRKEAAGIRDLMHEHAIENVNFLPPAIVEAAIDYVLVKASKDMPHFIEQDRPAKVKEIYKSLKRDHPDMPAEQKARIASRQGKPGKQKKGPPYEEPLSAEKSSASLMFDDLF